MKKWILLSLLTIIALGLGGCALGARQDMATVTPIPAQSLPPTKTAPTEAAPTAAVATVAPTTAPPTAIPTSVPPALTLELLRNTTFKSEIEPSGVVTLTDGLYEGQPFVPGGASRPRVALVEPVALGDLNGDGAVDAAVILATDAGGSGTWMTLEAMLNVKGQPAHIATASLGDRTQIREMSIADGVITLIAVTPGPDDPLCCPTQIVRSTFTFDGSELAQGETAVIGKVEEERGAAAAVLVDTTWQWLEYVDSGEVNSFTVSDPTKFTLTLLADGAYAIRADCNRGSGLYTLDGSSIRFAPGPMTRAFCGPDSQDTEYLRRLADVVTFVMSEGNLVLNLKMDAGNMVFAPMPAANAAGIYKGVFLGASSPGIDSTLMLNADGTLRLVSDYLNEESPIVELGHWQADGPEIAITLIGQENRDYTQAVTLTLTLSNEGRVVTEKAVTSEQIPWRWVRFEALARGDLELPYDGAAVTADLDQKGFMGLYKAFLPSATCCGRDLTLLLAQDGSARLVTDFMNDEAPIIETGTWQVQDGRVALRLVGQETRRYDQAVTMTMEAQSGLLVTLAEEGGAYGQQPPRFYNIKGLVAAHRGSR